MAEYECGIFGMSIEQAAHTEAEDWFRSMAEAKLEKHHSGGAMGLLSSDSAGCTRSSRDRAISPWRGWKVVQTASTHPPLYGRTHQNGQRLANQKILQQIWNGADNSKPPRYLALPGWVLDGPTQRPRWTQAGGMSPTRRISHARESSSQACV